MFEFAEKHKALSSKFAILTLHASGDDVNNAEKLNAKLDELSKNVWNGKKFPFPIIIDATMDSMKAWGVRGYPTAFIINPEGKIVASGHPMALEAQFEEAITKK